VFGQLPAHLIPSSEAVRNTHADAAYAAPQDLVDIIVARWRGATINNKHVQFEETAIAPVALTSAYGPGSGAAPPQSLRASAPEPSGGGVSQQQSLRASVFDRSSILKKNVTLA
jgi:hypothetical protein